jgi:hypothetical protein
VEQKTNLWFNFLPKILKLLISAGVKPPITTIKEVGVVATGLGREEEEGEEEEEEEEENDGDEIEMEEDGFIG